MCEDTHVNVSTHPGRHNEDNSNTTAPSITVTPTIAINTSIIYKTITITSTITTHTTEQDSRGHNLMKISLIRFFDIILKI